MGDWLDGWMDGWIYWISWKELITRCLRKNCAKLLLSELRQISINFNKFWQVDGKMAEILCYIYIFHLTSLIYRTTLLNTKVPDFTVSQENCEQILSELCPISINLITFGRHMTKQLKLYAWCSSCVPRSTDTSAETTAPLAAIAASRIDWSKRPHSSTRRISSSLTLAILDR